MIRPLADLMRLFFPVTCHVCGRTLVEGEELLCLECNCNLPRTEMHLHPDSDRPARLLTALKARRLASYFFYKDSNPYSALIRDAKYHSQPHIDRQLARMFARELIPTGFFDGIDVIIPVPMYFWKQARRGYNQAREIAEGIAEVTGIEVGDNLVAVRPHKTQTRRSAEERRKLASEIYRLAYPDELADRHILLVDDVLTTGATLSACAEVIHRSAPTATLSLLTLAATHYQ